MAHRLNIAMRRLDRILKNGLLNGNFNNLAQVQPRYSQFNLTAQPSVPLSRELPKALGKTSCRKRSNNGAAAKMNRMRTGGSKEIDKIVDNASSTSRPDLHYRLYATFSSPCLHSDPLTISPQKCELEAPNQNSKFRGEGGGEGDKNKNSGERSTSDKDLGIWFFAVFICGGGFVRSRRLRLEVRRRTHKKSYEEITWNDYVEIYYSQGRVAKVKVIDENWLRVYTATGTSTDGAKILQLRIDSLGSIKHVAPVTKTLEMKVECKNEAPDADKNQSQRERDLPGANQKPYSRLRSRFFYYGRRFF